MDLARALATDDLKIWQGFSHQVIQHLALGLIAWAKVEDRDVRVAPLDMIRRWTGLSSWARLSLTEILLWGIAGTFTEEERKALASSF